MACAVLVPFSSFSVHLLPVRSCQPSDVFPVFTLQNQPPFVVKQKASVALS